VCSSDLANPVGTILSAAMMCRYSLGWPEAADAMEAAVDRVIAEGARTVYLAQPGQTPIGTCEMGDRIAAAVSEP